MKKRFLAFVVLCLLRGSVFSQVQQLLIDPSVSYQTIADFAASDAWSANFVGKYWAEKERAQIADWLFSREFDENGKPKGIGLSLWRVNAGAGTLEQAGADILPFQRRAESFLGPDGRTYDWSKAAGQQYFMEQAAKRGCNNFLLFSNSPLVHYTLNGKGWSAKDNEANINPGDYDKQASYLAEVALFYRSRGWNLSSISPINEPQVKWNTPRQEGSPWRKSQVRNMFVALDKALSAKPGLADVRMLPGETADLKVIYQQDTALRKRFGGDEAPDEQAKAFFDPKSPFYIGDLKHLSRAIAGHAYHDHASNERLRSVRSGVDKVSRQYGVDYLQTEWCLLPNYLPPMDGFTADWKPGNRGDIQVALLMGRIIYSDLVDANTKSWSYWKGMELKGDHALIALHANNNEINRGGTVSANKILWALGNFSLFVRPGYQRVSTTGADDLNSLAAVSFCSTDRSTLVTVLVNSSFEDKNVELSLPPVYRKRVKDVSVYLTNEGSDLARTVKKDAADLRIQSASRSLTTIVMNLEAGQK